MRINPIPVWNSRLRCLLAASAALGACLSPLAAQKPPTAVDLAHAAATREHLNAGPAYTSTDGKGAPQFPEIDLAFTLRGADGGPVAVHPSELALFVQGQQIASCTGIRSFDHTGYGITTVVVLDASGAMHTAPASAFESAIAILTRQARQQDRVALLTLAEDTRTELPFRSGSQPSAPKPLSLRPRGKSTRLYDGLLDALALFPSAPARRRQLVILSDGRDQGSQHTLADVVLKASSLGVTVDAVGMAQGVDNALVNLQQLAVATGGVYLRVQDGQQLQQAFALGAAAAMATPVATFPLSHVSADGQLVSVQLRWLRGALTAPAFIQTPKIPRALHTSTIPAMRLLSSPWVWGFGGCFLLGLILFLFSLRTPRKPAEPEPQRQPPSTATPPSTYSISNPSFTTPPTSRYRADYQQPRYVEAEVERRKSEFAVRFDPAPNGPFARLAVKNNKLAGQSFPVTHTGFSVGALPGNDLVLPGDLTISGRHLRLYWENGVLLIEDNHSTNGTYLNRLRLPAGRHPLKPGDEIGIGQTFLVIDRL